MKEIGGFFDITANHAANKIGTPYLFNASRYALEYLLSILKPPKLYVPYYMCHFSIPPALENNKVEPIFYEIDESFMPKEELDFAIPLFYVNYFGLCDKQAKVLSTQHKTIIFDYAQAYFSPVVESAYTIKSPRKFFALPDGGELYLPSSMQIEYPAHLKEDISFDRGGYIYKRPDVGASEVYAENVASRQDIAKSGIRIMSKLTKSMLERVDLDYVKSRRRINYKFLDKVLASSNKVSFELAEETVPMFYPYLIENGKELRDYLISHKVYVAKYWPDIRPYEKCEYLIENLLAIPCDQRYDREDMQRILNLISNFKSFSKTIV